MSTERPLVQSFNTHRMTDTAIRALMTGREAIRDDIVAVVKANRAPGVGARQHVLVQGPRGFGKYFLARAVQIALAEVPGPPPPFLLLPEEQVNLVRNPHALPATIAAKLADQRTGTESSLRDTMFQWPPSVPTRVRHPTA